MNPYKNCPVYENEHYQLRLVEMSDAPDLLLVYSDEKAVPYFNSDNCHGDDFHYTTPERMESAVGFWRMAYEQNAFVRGPSLTSALTMPTTLSPAMPAHQTVTMPTTLSPAILVQQTVTVTTTQSLALLSAPSSYLTARPRIFIMIAVCCGWIYAVITKTLTASVKSCR